MNQPMARSRNHGARQGPVISWSRAGRTQALAWFEPRWKRTASAWSIVSSARKRLDSGEVRREVGLSVLRATRGLSATSLCDLGRRFARAGVVFGADFAAFRRRRLGCFALLGAGCRPLRALSRFFSKRSQCLELVSGSKGMSSRSLKTILPSSVTNLVFSMTRICEGE